MKKFFAAIFFAGGMASAQSGPCARALSIPVDFTGTSVTVQTARSGSHIKVCSYALTTATASASDLSFVSNPTGTVLMKLQATSAVFDNATGGQIQTALGESLGLIVSVSAHWTGRVAVVMETF